MFVYLYRTQRGKAEPVEIESLTRELLDTNGCYIVDCGIEVFVWMGRNTSLDERKTASGAADVIFHLSVLIITYVSVLICT